jgi:hypothetical protein
MQSFSLDGIQLIKNYDTTGTTGEAISVGGKSIECVYKASVSFTDSSIQIFTGPPGSEFITSKQRCWSLKTNDTSIVYLISPYESCTVSNKPKANNTHFTGTILKGDGTIKKGFGSNCSNTITVPEKYTAVGNGDFWLRPDYYAYNNQSALTADVRCFSPDSAKTLDSLDGKDPYSIIQTTVYYRGTRSCVTFEPHFAKGGIFVLTTSGECSSSLVKISGNIDAKVFVVTFPNYVSPTASTTGAAPVDAAAATVYKGPATIKPVDVIAFSNVISNLGSISILDIMDPCTIIPLRINQAEALKIKVENVLITSIDFDSKIVSIPPTSPANTYKIRPSDCSSGRRVLRELKEGIDFIMISNVAPQGRMLQPGTASGTATIGNNVVVPPGTIASELQTSITSAPAPSLAGTGALEKGKADKPINPSTIKVVLSVPDTWTRKVVYTVDPVIKFFNEVPRRCFTMCEGEATNKFTISSNITFKSLTTIPLQLPPPTMTYMQGALGVAAGMFALAVINLLIYIPSYCCGICACASCRCRKPRPAGSFKKILGVRTFFVLFGIIEIGMLVAAISYIPRFQLGFQQIFDGITMVIDTMKLAGRYLGDTSCQNTTTTPKTYIAYADANSTFTTVSTGGTCSGQCCPVQIYGSESTTAVTYSLGHAASLVTETANKLITACNTAVSSNDMQCPSAIVSGLQGVVDGMKTAINQSFEFGTKIEDFKTPISNILTGVPFDEIKSQLSNAGLGVIATLIFWVFCFSIFVFQNTFNCCMFGLCSTAMIPLATILMILAGIYYAIAILGSDFCIDPYNAIKSFFPNNGDMINDTIRYYFSCGEAPNTEVKGMILMFNPILDMVNTAITMIATMGDQIANSPAGANDPFVRVRADASKDAALGMSLYAKQMTSALNGVKGTVSCQQIDPIIATLFNGFCTNTIGTLGGIARIFIAASVFLFFQIGMGIDLCCFHPGYTSRYVAEDPDAADAGAGAPKPMIITGVKAPKAPKVAGSNPMHTSHV